MYPACTAMSASYGLSNSITALSKTSRRLAHGSLLCDWRKSREDRVINGIPWDLTRVRNRSVGSVCPLTRLTKTNVIFPWSSPESMAFNVDSKRPYEPSPRPVVNQPMLSTLALCEANV